MKHDRKMQLKKKNTVKGHHFPRPKEERERETDKEKKKQQLTSAKHAFACKPAAKTEQNSTV